MKYEQGYKEGMRIIVFGDLHGSVPMVSKKILSDTDLILNTGDFCAVNNKFREFQIKNNARIKNLLNTGISWQEAMRRILGNKTMNAFKNFSGGRWEKPVEKIISFGKPVLFVFGNADSPSLLNKLSKEKGNFISLHGKLLRFNSLNFVGIGDYIRPDREKTGKEIPEFERKIDELLKKTKARRTVILSHYPPYGIMDEVNGIHRGLRFLSYLIRKHKPLLFVCGHIHEKRGIVRKGNTYIVNAGEAKKGGILIEIQKTSVYASCLR
jgi:Icc-related predicted phosphoesterase